MSDKLATYSPEDVTVVIAGFIHITGFASDTFLNIQKYSDTFTERESSDGVTYRLHKKSDLYKVTLTLAQTSDSNQVLTYIHKVDEVSKAGKFPLIIKDHSGSSLFFASQCWIRSIPDSDFSTEINTREWELSCYGGQFNVAGNYGQSEVYEDVLRIGAGILGGVV